MMKAYYSIYLTIDGTRVYMNEYTSRMSLSFSHNLCSTAWKSAVDSASCKLVFNDRNVQGLALIISKLVAAQQAFPPESIGFEVLDGHEENYIFRGELDLGKLTIESAVLPGSVSLSAKSCMDKLDVKPKVNFVLYPATVKTVVDKCIAEAGLGNIVKWNSDVASRNIEVPFVVTEDDSDTWRNKIDTLLAEMGGHTFTYDHKDDKFYVSKVNDASKPVPHPPVTSRVTTNHK